MTPPRVLVSLVALVALLGACSLTSATTAEDGVGALARGTWGANGSGVIVNDTMVHVHIGCTKGDFPLPVALDAEGRFAVSGTYMLRAYPVQREGDVSPAQLAGVVRGNRLTFSVAVNDTLLKRPVALGPATVTLGTTPVLGPCPICSTPGEMAGRRRQGHGLAGRVSEWFKAAWRFSLR